MFVPAMRGHAGRLMLPNAQKSAPGMALHGETNCSNKRHEMNGRHRPAWLRGDFFVTFAHTQAAAVGGVPVADFCAFDSMRPPAFPLLLRTKVANTVKDRNVSLQQQKPANS